MSHILYNFSTRRYVDPVMDIAAQPDNDVTTSTILNGITTIAIRAPFRLLDLAPEMRNRIYRASCYQAFSVPLMISYIPKEHRGGGTYVTPGQPDRYLHQLFKHHDNRRGPEHVNRLALLATCRQVYNKASRLFYSHMSLDFKYICLALSLRSMKMLSAAFGLNLQHIQHMEIDLVTGSYWLFRRNTDFKRGLDNTWKTLTPGVRGLANAAIKIRKSLSGLKSVPIYPVSNNEMQPVGPVMIPGLEQVRLCQTLKRLFPCLRDVVTINSFGAERFHQLDSGQWECWYSKEWIPQIPLFTLANPRRYNLFSHDTGLSGDGILKELRFSQDQAASATTWESGYRRHHGDKERQFRHEKIHESVVMLCLCMATSHRA